MILICKYEAIIGATTIAKCLITHHYRPKFQDKIQVTNQNLGSPINNAINQKVISSRTLVGPLIVKF